MTVAMTTALPGAPWSPGAPVKQEHPQRVQKWLHGPQQAAGSGGQCAAALGTEYWGMPSCSTPKKRTCPLPRRPVRHAGPQQERDPSMGAEGLGDQNGAEASSPSASPLMTYMAAKETPAAMPQNSPSGSRR